MALWFAVLVTFSLGVSRAQAEASEEDAEKRAAVVKELEAVKEEAAAKEEEAQARLRKERQLSKALRLQMTVTERLAANRGVRRAACERSP